MLTYCTNIHPGESWREIFANIRQHVPTVKARFSPAAPFPMGLRLSGRAVAELTAVAAAEFHHWCREHECFVATMNGFPYGTFHHVPIKAQVYRPDWRQPERLSYTKRLALLFAAWLPDAGSGSISTVPLGFRAETGPDDLPVMRDHLRLALEHLDDLAQRSGKKIVLAVEPEPGCLLETTEDVVRFFDLLDLPGPLRPFLAVCFDCCHQALQFETPALSLKRLAEHAIPIGHVQVSSALRLEDSDLGRLQRFCEPCYLHQAVGRRGDGSLVRYDDLDQAIAAARRDVAEWRVHFHLPVFIDRLPECNSTQPFLAEILPLLTAEMPLEVETYTWSVLPPELRSATVTESIVRELTWVASHRGAKVGGQASAPQSEKIMEVA